MPHHGFRIYLLKVHRGHGREAVDFSATGARLDQPFSEVLAETLSGHVGATLDGIPLLMSSKHGVDVRTNDSAETRTRFVSASRSGNHLSIVVRYGREGDFDVAVGQSDDVGLEDRATTRTYRVEVLLPARGTTGLLVVEAVGSVHPTKFVTGWLSLLSKRAAEAIMKQVGVAVPWWKLRVEPYSDNSQLERLIQNAQQIRLEFRKHARSASGLGRVRELTLIQDIRTATMMDKVKALLRAWRDTPGASPVDDLGNLVHGDVTPLGFTDGEVVVEDDSGRIHRIRPGMLEEVFVYPLGEDDRPSDDVWKERVGALVSQVATEKSIELAW